MSSLSENGSQDYSGHDVVIKLLQLQDQLLAYCMEAIYFIDQLPDLTNSKLLNLGEISIDTHVIFQRRNIVVKYTDRIESLSDFHELHQIYDKIASFTKPMFTKLLEDISQVKHVLRSNSSDSEEESPDARSSDQLVICNNIKHFLVDHLFPQRVFEEAIEYLLDQDDLESCASNDSLVDAKLDAFPDIDDLMIQSILVLRPAIQLYAKVYPLDKSITSLYCFYQSIKKETLFDPKQKIELLSHPSGKVYTSLHGHVLRKIDHLKHIVPITKMLLTTTYYRLKQHDIQPDQPSYQSSIKFQDTFLTKLNVQMNVDDALKLLNLYKRWLSTLLSSNANLQRLRGLRFSELPAISCKEQFHLVEKLEAYLSLLSLFLDTAQTKAAANGVVASLNRTNDQIESAYFVVTLFELRMKYEARIIHVLFPECSL